MTAPYRLEDVLAREDVKKLPEDSRRRVVWAYDGTFAAYESQRPYRHADLPGIVGVQIYLLNKSIVAYGAAVREAERQEKEVRS